MGKNLLTEAETLLDPLDAKPVLDNSSEFDLPYALSKLPRPTSYDYDVQEELLGISTLGDRTVSEGRSYGLPPTVFKYKGASVPINYTDTVIKGGGAEFPEEAILIKGTTEDETSYVAGEIPVRYDGKKVRFSRTPTYALTSKLGIHSVESGKADMYTSKYLANQGLRTRALIAVWEYPDDFPFSTDEGVMPAKKFKENGSTPGIEVWAQRSRLRLSDLSKWIETKQREIESRQGDLYANPVVFGATRDYVPERNPTDKTHTERYLSHLKENFVLSAEEEVELKEKMIAFAEHIIVRAGFDSHPEFRTLAAAYGDKLNLLTNETNLHDFYKSYLDIFSRVLGEQFGIMASLNCISGMYNSQNLTVMAEIVDHDVSVINGQKFDEDGKLRDLTSQEATRYDFVEKKEDLERHFKQLLSGIESFNRMVANLNLLRAIDIGSNQEDRNFVENLNRNFLDSYFRKSGFSKEQRNSMAKYARSRVNDESFLNKGNMYRTYTDYKKDFLGPMGARYSILNLIANP